MTSLLGLLMGIINSAWLNHKSWFLFKPLPILVLPTSGTQLLRPHIKRHSWSCSFSFASPPFNPWINPVNFTVKYISYFSSSPLFPSQSKSTSFFFMDYFNISAVYFTFFPPTPFCFPSSFLICFPHWSQVMFKKKKSKSNHVTGPFKILQYLFIILNINPQYNSTMAIVKALHLGIILRHFCLIHSVSFCSSYSCS